MILSQILSAVVTIWTYIASVVSLAQERAKARVYSLKVGESGQLSVNFIVTGLIFVLIAVNIVPIIVTTVTDATGTGGALEGTDVAPLFDFLPLLITIGVVVAVVAFAITRNSKDL